MCAWNRQVYHLRNILVKTGCRDAISISFPIVPIRCYLYTLSSLVNT